MMKAYKIDSTNQTIEEVEIVDRDDDGCYYSMREHVGCDMLEAFYLDRNGTCLMLDEEGLFKSGQRFFTVAGYPNPIGGNAVCVGTDDQGDTCEPLIGIDELRRVIGWINPFEAVVMNNRAVSAAHAEAAIINARGGSDFVVVAAPFLTINEEGEAEA